MSATTGTPTPASSATDTEDTKPSTEKFEGWIFITSATSWRAEATAFP
jgi:hypothetical protein